MGWGNVSNVTNTHLDADTDSPANARSELNLAVLELQNVINGRGSANGVAPLNGSSQIASTYIPDTITSSVSADLTLDPDTDRVNIENLANLNPQTVAQLNAVTAEEGDVAYCSNGDGGNKCLAVYDGSAWKKVAFGTTISAT